MNQNKIIDLEKEIKENHSNITGLMIIKNKKTVYEKYFNDCDEKSTIHVYSVTKSILSLLIGIAIDQGYIKDVHQKVLDFFPEYKINKKRKWIQDITLHDLLSMKVSYKYKSMMTTSMRYFSSKDWVKFSLDLLSDKQVTNGFYYTPLVGPDILSGILIKATQQSVFDYATKNLFTPMNIGVEKNISFKSIKDQLQFNKATNRSGWVVDPKGVNSAGWGLTLSLKDIAKIGQLIVDDGYFENMSIVSSSWLKTMTIKHNHWQEMNLDYGYLWWVMDEQAGECVAMGDGGNVIYFNKEKNIVIAIHALFIPKAKDRIALIRKFILPHLEND